VQSDTLSRPGCISKEIKNESLFDYLDSCAGHRSNKCPRDLSSRCVTACMCNAIAKVTTLTSQSDRTRWIKIKLCTECDQAAYGLRAFSD
jgi:hypothetical protein